MDMSRFQDEPREGFQNRGWVMSGTETATSVRGRCVKFQFIIRGLNAESLRIIRVDIDTSRLHGEESEETQSEPDNESDTSNSFRSILGREMEDTIGGGASLVKVNNLLSSLFGSPEVCPAGRGCLGEGGPDRR